MARLKLLVFALPALGLWLVSLSNSSEVVAARAQSQAVAYASRAADALTVRLDARRNEIQTLLMKLQTSSALYAAAGPRGRVEAPTAEHFNAVRDAVLAGFPEADRATLVVGMSSAGGTLLAKGTAEGAPNIEGLEPDALVQSGTDGLVKTVFGEPYLFYALPLSLTAEGKPAPVLMVGAPFVKKGIVADVAKEMDLEALGLASNHRLIASAGTDPTRAQEGLTKASPGTPAVLTRLTGSLGPFKLPLGLKEGAPALVAVRRSLSAAPVEMVAVASAEALTAPLLDGQKTGLSYLFIATALGIVALFWMGGGTKTGPRRSDEEDAEALDPEPAAAPPHGVASPEPAAVRAPVTAHPPPHASSAEEAEEGTMAAPPAFDFPPPPPTAPPAAARGGFDFGSTFGLDSPGVAAPAHPPFDFDNHPTTSYPVLPNMDAYTPGAPNEPGPSSYENDFNPDATRVAAVPSELIAATQRNAAEYSDRPSIPLPPPRALAAATPPGLGTVEEQHFQDVFREFIATRERCGEPADGLAFEKFAVKLKKNRELLVQKYACRTVRFQVYVKEGKAALKATPVKD